MGSLHVLDGTMNAERYKKVLEQQLAIIITYIIIAISQIQRRFILHVSQHCISAGLAEEGGDGSVLSPHCEVQGRAAVKHGSIHICSLAE